MTTRPRIAVVEDNEDNLLLVTVLLEEAYDLFPFMDGQSAVDGMGETRPDLVLLDISLPGMSGLDVLKKIRANPALSKVPVVALTAHAMTGDRERLLKHGFDAYVSKPIVDPGLLRDTLSGLLTR